MSISKWCVPRVLFRILAFLPQLTKSSWWLRAMQFHAQPTPTYIDAGRAIEMESDEEEDGQCIHSTVS